MMIISSVLRFERNLNATKILGQAENFSTAHRNFRHAEIFRKHINNFLHAAKNCSP